MNCTAEALYLPPRAALPPGYYQGALRIERDFNALLHTILTTLQAVTEKHGENAVMPLLTQLQEVLTPLVQRPAAECGEVANALEQIAIERRRAALEVEGGVPSNAREQT
jgi:hypothetical protein